MQEENCNVYCYSNVCKDKSGKAEKDVVKRVATKKRGQEVVILRELRHGYEAGCINYMRMDRHLL